MKKQKAEFKINIWDYIDIDRLNEALDNDLNLTDSGAVEIDYKIMKINKVGDLTLVARFIKEDF